MTLELKLQIASCIGEQHHTVSFNEVGGGSINDCYRINIRNDRYCFCKVNSATKFPHLFSKEKKGLEFITSKRVIKTPVIIDCFTAMDKQVLIMEWIESAGKNESFWKLFGEQLAAMHHVHHDQFGWIEDNYMGSVPQQNTWKHSWCEFFIEHRLQPLVTQCSNAHLLSSENRLSFEKLYSKLPVIFNEEKPSLVHGDLWSGNYMCDEKQLPVLIDPAVYFGHRSIDLGMTTLFGGFDKVFYESYNYHYSFPPNYREQWSVANLYPLLIHLILFGRSYLHQIEQILNEFNS